MDKLSTSLNFIRFKINSAVSAKQYSGTNSGTIYKKLLTNTKYF